MIKRAMLLAVALGLAAAGCQGTNPQPTGKSSTAVSGTQPGATQATTKNAEKNGKGAATQEAMDEFQQMEKLNGVTGAQLTRVEAGRKAFYDGLAKLNDGPLGQANTKAGDAVKAARDTKDPDKIKAAEEAAHAAHAAYMKERSGLRAMVMAEFTLPQQQKWAGVKLAERVHRKLRAAKVDDAQRVKIDAICARRAAEAVQADTISADPYLFKLDEQIEPAVTEIKASVLTAEQRAALEPKVAATQEANKTADPKNGGKKE